MSCRHGMLGQEVACRRRGEGRGLHVSAQAPPSRAFSPWKHNFRPAITAAGAKSNTRELRSAMSPRIRSVFTRALAVGALLAGAASACPPAARADDDGGIFD